MIDVRGDRVLVKPEKEVTQTAGGILLPDGSARSEYKGKVVSIGRGKMRVDGTFEQPDFQVGDTVMFSRYGGSKLNYEGEEYLAIDSSHIYCVVDGNHRVDVTSSN